MERLLRTLFLSCFFAFGHELVELTRGFDALFASSDLSRWMDIVDGRAGGWHHRIKQGHDLLCNFPWVLHRFGWEGVARYPFELFRDFMTPHGLPLPGVQSLWSWGLVPASFATHWLSLNVAEAAVAWVAWRSRSGYLVCLAKGMGGALSGSPVLLLAFGRDAHSAWTSSKSLVSRSAKSSRDEIFPQTPLA